MFCIFDSPKQVEPEYNENAVSNQISMYENTFLLNPNS